MLIFVPRMSVSFLSRPKWSLPRSLVPKSEMSVRYSEGSDEICERPSTDIYNHHPFWSYGKLKLTIIIFLFSSITMKCTFFSLAILALAISEVAAFPKLAREHAERLAGSPKVRHQPRPRDPLKKRANFDAAAQYVSTKGAHAFVAPNFGAGDVRGPCPGLNAAANHGYIPHNGVGTIGEIINGTNTAFGMALDLGTFLALYGATFDGNLLGYSIGGPTSLSELPLNNVLGLTGAPQGLSGSHNKYEGDTSPTRGDLYQQ